MQYLSDEWFVAANAALESNHKLTDVLADVRITIGQTVLDAPSGTVTWGLVIDRGSAQLVVGPIPHADVRFRTSYQVAAAVAAGRLGAPAAFLRGDLSVGGDLHLLTANQRALAAVDDVLAEVRQATDLG